MPLKETFPSLSSGAQVAQILLVQTSGKTSGGSYILEEYGAVELAKKKLKNKTCMQSNAFPEQSLKERHPTLQQMLTL